MKLLTSLIAIIIASFILNNCNKGPYGTVVYGYVIDNNDSTKVPLANVYVLHWDGNDKHDTTLILETKCDSKGYFSFEFETDEKYDFFWAKAKKEGFSDSSMESIDAGSDMGCIIVLYP
jgi:hypothetical protein